MINTNFHDEITIAIQTRDGMSGKLKLWFSDNEAIYGDSVIGYECSLHGLGKPSENDGGEMDYDSEEKDYDTIEDAIEDILHFAFDDRISGWSIISEEE